MARTVGIGKQNFDKVVANNNFYVDKTLFIKEWWENEDDVTLIARPRRFGKTLNLSMVEQFFSLEYANRRDLFENLNIWREEKYRNLQGTYPVIAMSFGDIKEITFRSKKSHQRWKIIWHQILYGRCRIICSVIMGKSQSSFWMSTILLCRKPTCTGTGRRLRSLSEACLMLPLRRIPIWTGQL